MKTYQEDINATRCELVAEITQEDVSKEQERLIKDFARQAKLPGFRPGKAPVNMIRQRYAKEISEELKRKLASAAYDAARKENEVTIYSLVEVKDDDFSVENGGDIRFVVDIQPEFALPAYEGIAIEAPDEAVTDEEFVDARQSFLEQRSEFKISENAAEKGNFVKIAYHGTLDGQALTELIDDRPEITGQDGTWEEAGSQYSSSPSSIPQTLVGLNTGDTTEVEHTFADDDEIEALQGKSALYQITVQEIRQRVLPELDETFLSSLDVDSVEAFDERLREQIAQRKQQQIGGYKRQQALHKLVEQTGFAVPETAVSRERDSILREYIQQRMTEGMTQEDIEANQEKLLEESHTAAEHRVKAQFILMEIAKAQNIELKPEDMQQALIQEAMAARTPPEKLAKEIQKDEQRLREMQRQSLFAKTLDYIMDKANVTIKQPEPPSEATPAAD